MRNNVRQLALPSELAPISTERLTLTKEACGDAVAIQTYLHQQLGEIEAFVQGGDLSCP